MEVKYVYYLFFLWFIVIISIRGFLKCHFIKTINNALNEFVTTLLNTIMVFLYIYYCHADMHCCGFIKYTREVIKYSTQLFQFIHSRYIYIHPYCVNSANRYSRSFLINPASFEYITN